MSTTTRKHFKWTLVIAAIIILSVSGLLAFVIWYGYHAPFVSNLPTETMSITGADFSTAGHIVLTLANTGSSTATVAINTAQINDLPAFAITPVTVPYNTWNTTVDLTYAWTPGVIYIIRLTSQKGNVFTYTATAPS